MSLVTSFCWQILMPWKMLICSFTCVINVTFKDILKQNMGWIHLHHTRIAVALARANFLLFFGPKTKENSHALKRQLYEYGANESTLDYERFGKNLHVLIPSRSDA